MIKFSIGPATDIPDSLDNLLENSQAEGFQLVLRLVTEWRNKENCFSLPGEFILQATVESQVVGVVGVNIDPYASDPTLARLRHLYVKPQFRECGIGTALVNRCIERAKDHFVVMRLRAPSNDAASFYHRLGFTAVSQADATHSLQLSEHE